ncbi:MAG: Ig-like domain-containing protein [Planctomycetales bacterium]|nr:Ig-like domain-containing protein [Planctomycetales bacterium]
MRDAKIELDEEVFIRFEHNATTPQSRTFLLNDLRIGTADLVPPSVVRQVPEGVTPGVVDFVEVTFSEPVQPLHLDQVTIHGPTGQVIGLSSAPIDTGDQRTFILPLATTAGVPGVYDVMIEGTVLDLAGNSLDTGVNSKPYVGVFRVAAAGRFEPSEMEGFEAGGIAALPSWEFAATTGHVDVADVESGHAVGLYSEGKDGSQAAVLVVDLSDYANRSDLELDFDLFFGELTYQDVFVSFSGDGLNWRGDIELVYRQSGFNRYVIDLDQALNHSSIVFDEDVFVRFHRYYRSDSRAPFIQLDNVHIGDLDLFAPTIESIQRDGEPTEPVGRFTVTFSEPIEPLNQDRITVTDPLGRPLELAGPPVDTGDHRSFSFELAMPQYGAGNYRLAIGPNVVDMYGNASELLVGTFAKLARAAIFPVWESFDGTPELALEHWTFSTATGVINITNDGDAHSGGSSLEFETGQSQLSNDNGTATVMVDTSTRASDQSLVLDFWASGVGGLARIEVLVSADGNLWRSLGNITCGDSGYTQAHFDLWGELTANGMQVDDRVFVQFRHRDSILPVRLDDIRVTSMDLDGPAVLTAAPIVSDDRLTGLAVTFSEPIMGLTPSDITLRGPFGEPVHVASSATKDNRTFSLFLEESHTAGVYLLTISADVQDLAGNRLNMNGGAINGNSFILSIEFAATPAPFPLAESFEVSDLSALSGWYFSTADRASITSDYSPLEGTSQLLLSGDTPFRDAKATLTVDLAGRAEGERTTLDFWAKATSGSQRITVYARNSGQPPQRIDILYLSTEFEHFNFDLDREIGTHVRLDEIVFFDFLTSNANSPLRNVLIDSVRVSDEDVVGPQLLSLTPDEPIPGTVPSLTLAFDEGIAGFPSTAIRVTDPGGNLVAIDDGPVAQADGRSYVIRFSDPLSAAGTYHVVLDGTIRDFAGNGLNQYRLPRNGDAYTFTFTVTVTPVSFPYEQTFEGIDLSDLHGWQFEAQSGGIQATSEMAPQAGLKHLLFTESLGNDFRDAILAINLDEQFDSAGNVSLEFWARGERFYDRLELAVSGDGLEWNVLENLELSDDYTQFVYDLRSRLADAWIEMDSDVYVRFRHETGDVAIDNVRISNADVLGPFVTAQTAIFTDDGSVTGVTLMFNEPVTDSGPNHLEFLDPIGSPIAIVAPLVASDNGRTITAYFSESQLQTGTFTVRVGSDTRDLAGNSLNQDQGSRNAVPYQGTFHVEAVPITIPYFQDFENVDDHLPGWEFQSADGRFAITTENLPHAGSYHLTSLHETNDGRDAVLVVDLSAHAQATDLVLDFWAKSIRTSPPNYVRVSLSADGDVWTDIETLYPGTTYQHFQLDLDAGLDAAGIASDRDVFIRFLPITNSSYISYQFALDDVAIRRTDTIAGDIDGNGGLDVADADALSLAIVNLSNNPAFDLNQDGEISEVDLVTWVEELKGTLLGDANLDYSVDTLDYAAWYTHWTTGGTAWSTGDFNADGLTDGSDFNIWFVNRFHTATAPPTLPSPVRQPRAAATIAVAEVFAVLPPPSIYSHLPGPVRRVPSQLSDAFCALLPADHALAEARESIKRSIAPSAQRTPNCYRPRSYRTRNPSITCTRHETPIRNHTKYLADPSITDAVFAGHGLARITRLAASWLCER